MKKLLLLIICAALAAVFTTGCVSVNLAPGLAGGGISGKGDAETYTWDVGEITEINVTLYCDIDYYSAPSDKVTLEIQPNLRDYVVVEESGGVLTVRSTRNINWSGKAPVLTVSTPALSRLSLAGAGAFTAHDTITADSFTLRMDGAGSGSADLDVSDLSITMAGAGSFKLSGKADTAKFEMNGAGSVDALSLDTRDATVNLSGVGTVKLSCSDNLRIDAGGLGTVEYKGSPSLDLNRGGMVTVTKVG